MGNGIGKLNICFAGDTGEISRRWNDVSVHKLDPLDEGLGHSFCYIRPDPPQKTEFSDDHMTGFRTISGASISANVSTPLSTALIDTTAYIIDKASAFESSKLFSALPLQPIPRSSLSSVRSGPIQRVSGPGSGPIERGFMSGPLERGLMSGPLENQDDQLQRYRPAPKKWSSVNSFKKVVSKSLWGSEKTGKSERAERPEKPEKHYNFNDHGTVSSGTNSNATSNSNTLSSVASLFDDDYYYNNESFTSRNVQWAQGKAGEDRVHLVISEEHGWVFVGIYDGFNGPDATDFLLSNLYPNVYKELKELLLTETSSINHSEVLKSLSEALRKTEESYLEIADMMLIENPELALMGSCVLVMLVKEDDVYIMNVGDSRAVLGQKIGSMDPYACQLTIDHCTSIEEEVQRIKQEHPDDVHAIMKDRVKGSLKVTRAFGAGFLKQPKWNNALLEMFRINYIGESPYITCCPDMYHRRLGPSDKFLILSSDGLYQYFTNEEVVSKVEWFMSTFPEADPAQHLIEEVLFRAAKKAGMDFYELLDIPQGDRRKYHDDVSVIIISFEGKIWRSFVE